LFERIDLEVSLRGAAAVRDKPASHWRRTFMVFSCKAGGAKGSGFACLFALSIGTARPTGHKIRKKTTTANLKTSAVVFASAE
jgi:hypothetical protein